jgi:hypothetical protein
MQICNFEIMKTKVYLLIFAGIVAISLAVFSLLTVDTSKEKWSSLVLGAIAGFFIVRAPKIIAALKGKKQAG